MEQTAVHPQAQVSDSKSSEQQHKKMELPSLLAAL